MFWISLKRKLKLTFFKKVILVFKRSKNSNVKMVGKKDLPKNNVDHKSINDKDRRLFLKAIGALGLSAIGISLFPKKGSALIMGGAPSASVVGVKNSSNMAINPATEDTLALLVKKTDLTFDGDDLQVKVTSSPSNFSDSTDISKMALVDADRHLQVDILSSALPSQASTETTLQTISFGGFKFALRMEAINNLDYIGEAPIGSLTSAAVWRIKRIENTESGLIITWAGTGLFDQVWDNYSSLSYL
jgi:hypothetical protein